jgi:hypothetical protein
MEESQAKRDDFSLLDRICDKKPKRKTDSGSKGPKRSKTMRKEVAHTSSLLIMRGE